MKVYLTGGIFFEGDTLRNTEWSKKIKEFFPGVDLYNPVENKEVNGKEGNGKFTISQEVASGDNPRLNNADILIVCIDGDILPSSTCTEVRKFHEKIERGDHKHIIGICANNRQQYLTCPQEKSEGSSKPLGEQQPNYQNLDLISLISQSGVLVSNIEDALHYLRKWAPEYQQEFIDEDDVELGE